jgi:hypothetical protein
MTCIEGIYCYYVSSGLTMYESELKRRLGEFCDLGLVDRVQVSGRAKRRFKIALTLKSNSPDLEQLIEAIEAALGKRIELDSLLRCRPAGADLKLV